MMTPEPGVYNITWQGEQARGPHLVWIPPPASWGESVIAPIVTYANALRPLVTAQSFKLTVTLPFTVSGYGVTAGGNRGHMKGTFAPTPRGSGQPYALPGFKSSLAQNDEFGVLSIIPITGVVATLVDSWITGIGGIKPANGRGNPFTACDAGALRKGD